MIFLKTLEELNIDYENEIKSAHSKYQIKHRTINLKQVRWCYVFNDTLKAKDNPTIKDVRIIGSFKRKNIIKLPVRFVPQEVFDYISDLKKKKDEFDSLPEIEKIKLYKSFFENFQKMFLI